MKQGFSVYNFETGAVLRWGFVSPRDDIANQIQYPGTEAVISAVPPRPGNAFLWKVVDGRIARDEDREDQQRAARAFEQVAVDVANTARRVPLQEIIDNVSTRDDTRAIAQYILDQE